MELEQYWRVLRKRLWVVALLIVVGMASTAFYTLQQPPEYDSAATLLLNPAVPSALVPYVQNEIATNLSDSYAELLRSQSFGDSVAKELPFPMSGLQVAAAVSTKLVPNTLFFKITGRTSSAEHSRQLVETVIKVFLSANKAQQQAQTDQGPGSLKGQMQDKLNTKLQYIGDQIKGYQDQIKALEAQPPGKDRDDRLTQLRGQLVSLQQTETDTIVAVGHLNDTSVPLNTALVIDSPPTGIRVPSRLPSNLLVALLVSALLGLGLAFLLNYMDYTVRSPEYLEQTLGLTPVAVVGIVGAHGAAYAGGRRPGRRRKATPAGDGGTAAPARLAGRNLVTLEYPKSPDSESFRVLRTNLQFSSLSKPIRTLVVTSASPGEGKSFTAANLAIVMAQAGKRVILVDTDLRRPSLHRLFGLSNTVGFTNLVLQETDAPGGALHAVPEVPNLLVVPSGPLPPNPSELLDSRQAVEVMARLAQGADLVIYDTPPATAVTDPAILASRADATVLVIHAGLTRRDVVARAKKILQSVGVRAPLSVLNQVKMQDIHGYDYYYRADGYETLVEAPPARTNGHDHSAEGRVAVLAGLNGHGGAAAAPTDAPAAPAAPPRPRDRRGGHGTPH